MTELFQELLVEEADEELGWQERALCAQTDPESFFPEKGGSTREAKKVCLACEVRSECLEYALANDERFGIWGGLSERERRRLKKQPSEYAAQHGATQRNAGQHRSVRRTSSGTKLRNKAMSRANGPPPAPSPQEADRCVPSR